MVYNIPRRHLPLLCSLTSVQKVAKFLIRQRQKRSKRLFLKIYLSPPPYDSLKREFGSGRCKYRQ